MKILYIVHQYYPHYGSGTEKVTYNIASMMQIAGNKVKVVTYNVDHHCPVAGAYNNISYNEYLYNKIPVIEFYLNNEPPSFHIDLVNDDVIKFAYEILDREKPDIVHVFHPMRVGGFIKAAQDKGIPCVVTATDLMFICPKIIMKTTDGELCIDPDRGKRCNKSCYDTGDHNEDRMNLSEQLLSGSDFVIAPSNFTGCMLQKQFTDLQVRTIKHGMDYTGVQRKSKVYGKNDNICFGFIGSIQEHKGPHILIDAFMKVKNKNIKLKMFGNGTGNYAQVITKKAKADERITLCGAFTPNMIEEIYSQIDVLIIPSLCYESYSMVKHEAIMRNIPVIVADIGALGDGITSGVNGYKYSLSRDDSLEKVIVDIANNPEKINNVKSNLQSYVVPTIEQESFQYFSLYKKCLANHK